MTDMSDEVKLAIVKAEMNDIMMSVKMLITVQTTIEAYRQYVSGELPETFVETVESDEFKDIFDNAVKAFNEIVFNLINFTDNVTRLFDVEFKDNLPKNSEEFYKMSEELMEQTKNYNEASGS